MSDVQEFNRLLRKIKYDEEAREKFFFLYFNKLRLHISQKYGNFSDWEDIVQDVTLKIIETDWTDYPYINNPMSWLYRIADNHAKDMFKKFNRICEFEEERFADFNIERVEMKSDVRDAMRHLKREMQYILYAQNWLGKNLYTIAKELGKTYVGVRVTAWRARNLLEKYL